jgi:PEGA domain-containing protein
MAAARECSRQIALRSRNLFWILLCCATVLPRASAQSAAESAGATSVAGGVAANAKAVQLPPVISAQPSQVSPHILASPSGHTVESNRQALEAKAGVDGARLLLRSMPSPAQVWVNNQPVGSTPLLLIVPPGKYSVEMRGSRQEVGRKELALLPKEIRDVAVKLETRYPTRVESSH